MIIWNKAVAKRSGVALALSGGGFRATLFHLGSLRRLNELGILGKLDAVSSVSGGSMMAACLADAMMSAGPGTLANFNALADKVHALTSCNLRRHVELDKLKPWNWIKGLAVLVAEELQDRITRRPLADLPTTPQFLFCATDMVFGVNWVYTHDCAGDWQAGYTSVDSREIGIAHAAAASACFPPVFAPIDTQVPSENLKGGGATGPDADQGRQRIRLTTHCDASRRRH